MGLNEKVTHFNQSNKQQLSDFSAVICSISLPAVFVIVLLIQYLQGDKSVQLTAVMSVISIFIFILTYTELRNFNNRSKNMAVSFVVLNLGMYFLILASNVFGPEHEMLFYIAPVAAYAILMKRLVGERIAIISTVWMALITASIFHDNFTDSFVITFLYYQLSQMVAIYFLGSLTERISLIKNSAVLLFTHWLLVIAFVIPVETEIFTLNLFLSLLFAAFSVLISIVLALGLLPLFEAALNLLTESKLLNLSNPNHPLLKKILIEAPGTYHHSVMVANLSESACEAIGANGLLARVAAYYHDVGKALRPHYFIENQQNMDNPHDDLSPEESAEIILAHPYEGAKILRQYKLPEEIIEITEQHHGTTLLGYFYHKKKKETSEVEETAFRYKGPIPQTKEAAIINICDSVEAAVRSKKSPTKQEIRKLVRSIINQRLMDEQLNDSQLALSDLKIIENSICNVLSGVFHERIDYPSESTQEKQVKEVHS
ncbi:MULTISPECIES: HD family phosphohydrolase [Allobacillus]|uniref:HDIG domain-containing protein n=1 Tax=Allobacillus salarius TaxID=1955272 RepID=A0A556PTM7_9BACI|nr:HDIG domain-containing metalloprotein [Allobacillus salarius]TSJ67742.1 HDIG domain-containing protein [Allobacillus salarius]